MKILSIERQIVSLPTEVLYLYNTSGKFLESLKGSKNQIKIPMSLVEKMPGNILTHNHPFSKSGSGYKGGWSFSANDMVMAVQGNLGQLRATGLDHKLKKPCVFVMNRPGSSWSMSVKDAQMFLRREIDRLNSEIASEDELSNELLTEYLYHELSSRFAKMCGAKYEVRYL